MHKLFLLGLIFFTQPVFSQCVVINEVLVNGPGACDGFCEPNTEEWIELYNTCTTPVDLSCYVITDGDFTVTLPQGTTIAANGYLVIGSVNSVGGGPIDINIGTCGCAAGNGIGVLTNPNEQVVLANPSGVIQDAIYWGSGQFPVNITSMTLGVCAPVTINIPNASGATQVPTSSSDGCTVARTCDGSSTWQIKCGSNISMGTTNGTTAVPDFTASTTLVCPGSCIGFTDNSTGNPISWFWTFSGAATGTSSAQNPSSICYNNPGNYTVTLQITNSCGTFTTSQVGYIQVSNAATPSITANGPTDFCTGGSVVLSTSGVGTYQWLLNSIAMAGETTNSITVSQAGTYALTVTSGTCSGTSNSIQVNVNGGVASTIVAQSSTTICDGTSVILNSGAVAATYQWLLNGTPIAGENSNQISVSTAGDYTLSLTSNDGCTSVSPITAVAILPVTPPTITTANGIFSFCTGQSITLNATAGLSNYQWNLNGNPIAGATTASLLVSQSGSYTINSVAANGCSVSSAAVVTTLLPLPNSTVTPTGPILICNANPVLLEAPGLGASYVWMNAGTPISLATNSSFIANASGAYSVEIVGANGCSAISNTVLVSFNTSISVAIEVSNPKPCMGDVVYLNANAEFNQITWSTGEDGIQIAVEKSGIYKVTVVSSGGCTATNEVDLQFKPKPFIHAGDDLVSDCIEGAVLKAEGDGAAIWTPELNMFDPYSLETAVRPTETTMYYLTVDNGECKAIDSVLVLVECGSVYVPSAFTPNNDGVNDIFKAQGMDLSKFSLLIFNRWGEKIFESSDINIGWDGTYKGTQSPIGTYVWRVEAYDKKGNSANYSGISTGVVHLVR